MCNSSWSSEFEERTPPIPGKSFWCPANCWRQVFGVKSFSDVKCFFWRQEKFDVKNVLEVQISLTSEKLLTSKKAFDVKKVVDLKNVFDVKNFLTSTIFLTSIVSWRQQFVWRQNFFWRQQLFWHREVLDVNKNMLTFLTSTILRRQYFFDVSNLFDVKKILTSTTYLTSKSLTSTSLTSKMRLTSKHVWRPNMFDVKNIFDVNTNLTSKKLLTSKKFGRQNSFWTSDFFPKLFCKDWLRLLRSDLINHYGGDSSRRLLRLPLPLLQRLTTRNSTRSTPWCSQILPLLLEP